MGQIPLTGDHWGGMVHVRRIAALIVLAVGTSLVLSALFATHPQQRPRVTRLNPLVSPDDSEPLGSSPAPKPWSSMGARLLYPYSIIPGGVRSSRELKIAIANDPVVASHYHGFDFPNARVLILDRDRMAYVSYRLNNRVFWTSKKVKLAKGEALISDGAHLARTRCGNRISEVPAAPVSSAEPTEETFEATLEPPLLPAAEPPFAPPTAPPPAGQTEPPSDNIFIPPIFPIWTGSGGPSSPVVFGSTPPPTSPPPPPSSPVSAPEPNALILLIAGITAVSLLRAHRS